MTCLFDTSVLVAALTGRHTHHHRAIPWLSRAIAGEVRMVLSSHSLAETYAVLTRTPPPVRVAPEVAAIQIREVARHGEVIHLDANDYVRLIGECAEKQLRGGAVYDYVIHNAAKKAAADHLLTFNDKHFRRFYPNHSEMVIVP